MNVRIISYAKESFLCVGVLLFIEGKYIFLIKVNKHVGL